MRQKNVVPLRSLLSPRSLFPRTVRAHRRARRAREVLRVPQASDTSTKIREGRCSDGKGATYSNHLNNFNLHTHSHRYQCFENRLFSPKKQLCSVFLFSVPQVSALAGPPTLHHSSSKVGIQNSTPRFIPSRPRRPPGGICRQPLRRWLLSRS